jgi:ABC-type branched-subunit amino acid transport system substrate-binding protein
MDREVRVRFVPAFGLMFALVFFLAAASLLVLWSPALAQISDNVVKIGVLNDQSGLYADLGGPGSVTAARMAAEDAGGTVLGKPIEIVFADHQNKADIGVAIARRWFETEGVDMTVGFDNSSIALAVEQLAARVTASQLRVRSAAPPSRARAARATRHPGSMTATH